MTGVILCFVGHVTITVAAIVGVAVRIEHRLTKIETNQRWLMNNAGCCEKGEKNGNCKSAHIN
jgi:hypothetical protein